MRRRMPPSLTSPPPSTALPERRRRPCRCWAEATTRTRTSTLTTSRYRSQRLWRATARLKVNSQRDLQAGFLLLYMPLPSRN